MCTFRTCDIKRILYLLFALHPHPPSLDKVFRCLLLYWFLLVTMSCTWPHAGHLIPLHHLNIIYDTTPQHTNPIALLNIRHIVCNLNTHHLIIIIILFNVVLWLWSSPLIFGKVNPGLFPLSFHFLFILYLLSMGYNGGGELSLSMRLAPTKRPQFRPWQLA